MEALILFKLIILVVVIQQSKIKHHQILHKQLQIIKIKIATAQLIKM